MFGKRRGPALRFRLFGTRIRIGIGFPITIVAVPLLLLGERGRDPRFLLAWLALVSVSVLVHEGGHVAALRMYGFRPEVSLNAFGGLTSTEDTGHLRPSRSILVSLAGPAAGIALGITIESALVPIGGQGVLWLRSASWLVNIGWSVVNLLPVMPLDGGHVVRELVEVASRRRGVTIFWLAAGLTTATLTAWFLVSPGHRFWVAIVAALMVATNIRYFAITERQLKAQAIDVAHEQLMDGDLDAGIATLLPVALSHESALVSDQAYTTLAWALLHQRRFVDLCQLNASRFHVQHRDLLDGATAWYRGDLYGAFNHVSTALADGRVEPPDTYFSRVFGRIGEMERLAHHISMLPSDASNRAAVRLRSGLAAAGAAA